MLVKIKDETIVYEKNYYTKGDIVDLPGDIIEKVSHLVEPVQVVQVAKEPAQAATELPKENDQAEEQPVQEPAQAASPFGKKNKNKNRR